MKNTIKTFKVINHIALFSLLFLLSSIPFFIDITPVIAFVYLPLFILMTFTISIFIEEKLNALTLQEKENPDNEKCILKNCLHWFCLN